ncbi:MAG: signal peptidase II [Oscillospiraceae bacterium]|jgi:signal peptidase II|nr:signal peptidase II [Oscillospiraceae bacterium]
MTKPTLWKRLAAVVAAALLVLADQWCKALAEAHLAWGQTKRLLPGVIQLRYTRNTGIAFSAFGESRAAMLAVSILTALAIGAALALLLAGKIRGAAPVICTTLITAGGLGNLIDRLSPKHYVVDYLEFVFVRFAVFNFADVCITVGVFALALWILFFSDKKKAPACAQVQV